MDLQFVTSIIRKSKYENEVNPGQMKNQKIGIAVNLELVYPGEVPVFEKYDEFVPDELVRKGFALGVLDIAGMKKRVRQWGREL